MRKLIVPLVALALLAASECWAWPSIANRNVKAMVSTADVVANVRVTKVSTLKKTLVRPHVYLLDRQVCCTRSQVLKGSVPASFMFTIQGQLDTAKQKPGQPIFIDGHVPQYPQYTPGCQYLVFLKKHGARLENLAPECINNVRISPCASVCVPRVDTAGMARLTLVASLSDPDQCVVADCLRAISELRDKQAVQDVIPLMEEKQPIAYYAALSLAILGYQPAVNDLMGTLMATDSISWPGAKGADTYYVCNDVAEVAKMPGAEAKLVRLLRSEGRCVRSAAALQIAQIATPKTRPVLKAMLQSPDPEVRMYGQQGMRRLAKGNG